MLTGADTRTIYHRHVTPPPSPPPENIVTEHELGGCVLRADVWHANLHTFSKHTKRVVQSCAARWKSAGVPCVFVDSI